MRLPGARRTVSKTHVSAKTSTTDQSSASTSASSSATPPSHTSGTAAADDGAANNGSATVTQLKHVQIPEMNPESAIMFETIAFAYAMLCLALQYIHIYKTVWWLPHSHANYALNFYLIDPHLALLLVVVMSRRLVWCFISEVYRVRPRSTSCFYWLVHLFKLALFVSLCALFAYAVYRVICKHALLYSLFLCYPLLMYFVLFGLDLQPFMSRVVNRTSASTSSAGGASSSSRPGWSSRPTKTSSQSHMHHACSSCPESIRDEAETLRADFNARIKQVLFHSVVCAYYMAYVPLCFTQKSIYYDTWWVGQHVCLVWLSAFVMFTLHFLPATYLDTLHRCSVHLGRWLRVEGRHAHIPYTAWSELQVWQQGALVKHVRGLFKAEGINNSAEPGNGMHARFYFMFHQPLRVTNWLLVISWALIIYQLLLLVQATDWSHIISLAFLLFCNYYELFKLMRDRLVLSRAYRDEQSAAAAAATADVH